MSRYYRMILFIFVDCQRTNDIWLVHQDKQVYAEYSQTKQRCIYRKIAIFIRYRWVFKRQYYRIEAEQCT